MAVPKAVKPPKAEAPSKVVASPKVVALSKAKAPSQVVASPKAKSKSKSVQNRHIYARSSYLYQATAYLSARVAEAKGAGVSSHGVRQGDSELNNKEAEIPDSYATRSSPDMSMTPLPGSARHLITQMRGVSRKTHTCLSKEIKRSVCKRCDTLLVPTETCTAETENASKGGKKPWADVYVATCLVCGTTKRFPTGMDRQKKKARRAEVMVDHAADATTNVAAGECPGGSAPVFR